MGKMKLSRKKRNWIIGCVSSGLIIVVLCIAYFDDRVYRKLLSYPSGSIMIGVADKVVSRLDLPCNTDDEVIATVPLITEGAPIMVFLRTRTTEVQMWQIQWR